MTTPESTATIGQDGNQEPGSPGGLNDLHSVARMRLERVRGLIATTEDQILHVSAREAKDLAIALQRLIFLERHLMRLVMGQEPDAAKLTEESVPNLGSRGKSQAAALRGSQEE